MPQLSLENKVDRDEGRSIEARACALRGMAGKVLGKDRCVAARNARSMPRAPA